MSRNSFLATVLAACASCGCGASRNSLSASPLTRTTSCDLSFTRSLVDAAAARAQLTVRRWPHGPDRPARGILVRRERTGLPLHVRLVSADPPVGRRARVSRRGGIVISRRYYCRATAPWQGRRAAPVSSLCLRMRGCTLLLSGLCTQSSSPCQGWCMDFLP